VPYVPSRPQGMLFFDNTFTLRPVPDKSYAVNLEVDLRPTELLAAGTKPDLEQWWQYIAYGAAKKIFEDNNDYDSVQQIMPEYKLQERLVLRKTLMQQASERTPSIYAQTNTLSGQGFFWGGGYY
jgi:hypothetical protein